MKNGIVIIMIMVMLLPQNAQSKTHQQTYQFYEESVLIEWKTKYQKSTQEIFAVAIWPFLSAEEKRRLINVKLDFPLVIDDGANPFRFYGQFQVRNGRVANAAVTMPVVGLKWLDDLSVANQWLTAKDCDLTTIFDYIALLKYRTPRQFSGGRYPPPLTALQIPANVFSDTKIEEISRGDFNEIRAFILAHELGHIYYRHPGYVSVSPEEARHHEVEADQFAFDVLRRSGSVGVGQFLYFFWLAHYDANRSDYASEEQWQNAQLTDTHPLTPERLYAVAADWEEHVEEYAAWQSHLKQPRNFILGMATDMAELARLLSDVDYQQGLKLAISNTDVGDLSPRCNTISPASEASLSFSGQYVGQWTFHYPQLKRKDDVYPLELTLQRTGDKVSGKFYFGVNVGHLEGTIENNTLMFYWEVVGMDGYGVLHSSADGKQLTGSWGVDIAGANMGEWDVTRE